MMHTVMGLRARRQRTALVAHPEGELYRRMSEGTDLIPLAPRNEIDLAAAWRGAERLRSAIARVPVRLSGQVHKISVSIGVATRLESTTSPEALIEAAQHALGVTRHAGPNRTCTAPPEPVPVRQSR